jgi:hypothetical protein
MRVLYIYVYYYENDKETIDHKDCIRTSFSKTSQIFLLRLCTWVMVLMILNQAKN